MEVLHSLVGVVLGLLQDPAGLLVGLPEDPFPLSLQLLLFLFQGFPERADLLFVRPDLLRLLLNGAAAGLQICQQILEAFILFTQMTSGVLDKEVRQAQLGGDGKGVTLARDADEEPVGWWPWCGSPSYGDGCEWRWPGRLPRWDPFRRRVRQRAPGNSAKPHSESG